MKFTLNNPNYKLSPYTGVTREHFIEVGKFLLNGIFSNIKDFNDPVIVERTETEITYPHLHLNLSDEAIEREKKAQRFEGLTRSFFIASPLIKNDPELTVNGYKLKDYYKNQILLAVKREGANAVGWYSDMIGSSTSTIIQQTVESAALCIGLIISKDYIWSTYTLEEKNIILDFITEYAYGNTNGNNWQFFNMIDLAFLKMNGREIDRNLMLYYAKNMLAFYSGNGFYRDGYNFDYYSIWGFNFYAPLWNSYYGYENMTDIALEFERISNELMEVYPNFFDKDGHMLMWGRSNIYRFAVASAVAGNMSLKNHAKNYGALRRVVSGALMQFVTRDDFMGENGVPEMGFYGRFFPLVQSYSCAESVLWLGKAFSLLALPKEHPFWTKKEKKGVFEKLSKKGVKETVLDGPALLLSNHKENGTTILRTGRVSGSHKNVCNSYQYARLSFNSKYPWEASLKEDIDANQYVVTYGGEHHKANAIYWCGALDKVLYRRQYFNYDFIVKGRAIQMDLADFTRPYGIIRVDRLLFRSKADAEITLSSYGFPDNGTEVIKKTLDNAKCVILKGKDKTGKLKQMAFTVYGDMELSTVNSENTNAESVKSIIVTAKKKIDKEDYSYPLFISQTLTKESHEDFTDSELFPIKKFEELPLGLKLTLTDNKKVKIDFSGIEKNMQM